MEKAQNNLAIAKQQLLEDEASVASAESSLLDAKSNVDLQKAEYDRKAILAKPEIVTRNDLYVAKQSYQSAKAQYQVALANLNSAKAKLGSINNNTQVQAAQLALNQAQLNLSYMQVHAPVAGHITNFSLSAGQYVNAGDVLFGMTENKPWRIRADLLEPFLQHIRVGDLVTFRLRMYPQEVYEGVVTDIGYGIDFSSADTGKALPKPIS